MTETQFERLLLEMLQLAEAGIKCEEYMDMFNQAMNEWRRQDDALNSMQQQFDAVLAGD